MDHLLLSHHDLFSVIMTVDNHPTSVVTSPRSPAVRVLGAVDTGEQATAGTVPANCSPQLLGNFQQQPRTIIFSHLHTSFGRWYDTDTDNFCQVDTTTMNNEDKICTYIRFYQFLFTFAIYITSIAI